MSELVRLWDLCARADSEGLSRLIRWDASERVVSYVPPREGVDWDRDRVAYGARDVIIARRHGRNEAPGPDASADPWGERLTPGELVLPALIHLQERINTHIDVRSKPVLLWALRHEGRREGPGHGPSPRSLGLRLRVDPENLRDLLWLQFAESVCGQLQFRECAKCGRWVLLGPEGARASRLYCSSACRTRGLRERRQEARSLREEGRSIASIAEELDSDVDTITRWLSGGKEAED